MNFKKVFKQVDFWLQFFHICGTILALILMPDYFYFANYVIMKIHTVFFGVFGLAILQILSTISNFLIYKNERNNQRKLYEKLTLGFILFLILITFIWTFPFNVNDFNFSTFFKRFFEDQFTLIPAFFGLTFISPFLAMWYLSITFRKFLKTLKFGKFGNWWQVPLVLSVLILVIFGFLQILTPQRY